MKILILYQFDINGQLIDALCQNLYKHGINADSLNVETWRFNNQNKKRKPLLIRLLATAVLIPKVKGLMVKLFRNRIILSLSEKYALIDIHFFESYLR